MKVVNVTQGSPEWYQARCGLPTASEFSRIVTPARADYSAQASDYIADLIVETIEGPQLGYKSRDMERGSFLEDEARSEYEFLTDHTIVEAGLVRIYGAGWSPDGLIGDKGAVEIKCPKSSTHVKWLLSGALPMEHKPQVHGALYIGELEWVDFVSYCPGYRTLIVREYPSDYTLKIGEALAQFLAEYEAAKSIVLEAA